MGRAKITTTNGVSPLLHRVLPLVLISMLGCPLSVVGEPPPEDATATFQLGAAAGTRNYQPGAWGIVEARVANLTDKAVELTAAGYFAEDPTLQYGRRTWVPAQSILLSTCPVRIPDSLKPGANHVGLVSVPIERQNGAVAHGHSPTEAIREAKPLIVNDEPVAVCILGDFEVPRFQEGPSFHTGLGGISRAPDDGVYDLVLAARRAMRLSRRVSFLNAWKLPADMAALDSIDVLVLCSNRLADDPDAIARIQHWVLGGGCLWVLLDGMEQESVSAVLGDAFTSLVVDRVKLTEFLIEDARPDTLAYEDIHLEFDEPVDFARVVPRDVTVTDMVNDWPAAFWQPFGEGKVFYTTLGPRAWYRAARSDDPKRSGVKYDIPFFAREPLARIADECFSDRHDECLDVSSAEPFLAKQIGYRIMPKETVAGILAVFCAILCVAGAWLWRGGRLDRLLWISPVAAVGTSLVFLVMASTARNSVPATVAQWQRIALEPGISLGHTQGLASLYNPETEDSEIGATRGGRLLPDMTAMRGRQRRIVWTDEGVWHWEGLELPPGIRTAVMEQVLHLDDTIDCRAVFGPSGLVGTLDSSPFTGLEDALIAIPGQAVLATTIRADGSFDCSADRVLASGEYLADTWLSDIQQRRSELYRLLLTPQPDKVYPKRPTLYAWADPVDMGFTFPQSNRIGSALLSIPVQMERSRKGTGVTVPASFISYKGVVGPDGNRPSAYSSFVGEWGEMSSAVTDWLRFQLPENVLPIEVSRAVIELDIRAPSRNVEILAFHDENLVVVEPLSHPIGRYEITVSRPELLQVDEQGGLTFAIRVGKEKDADVQNFMTQASWKVESLQMSVVGKVQGD